MKKNLVILLSTGFYSGQMPIAPGTFGTIAAMIIYFLVALVVPDYVQYIFPALFIVGLIPAVKVCDEAEKIFSVKDPQNVVIDEFWGYFLAVSFHAYSWKMALLAFVLFRIFDIIKPYPIYSLQKIKAGWGIMIDDLIAGLYANLILWLVVIANNIFSLNLF